MVRQIDEILTELGWTDGFHVPVANEENKALETELEAKMKEKAASSCELATLVDRMDAITKHSRNVKIQQEQIQALITAHNEEIALEENRYRLKQSEKAKLDQEIRQMSKMRQDIADRINSLQCDICRRETELEQLTKTLRWDKETMLAWEEELSRGEDDNTMLMRYTAQDDNKAKILDSRRQRVRMEMESQKGQLEKLLCDVKAREMELDKMAQMFQRGHLERQEIIHQWENSVKVLHQRDHDINYAIEEMNRIRERARAKVEVLREKQNFFENQASANRELDRQIAAATRQSHGGHDELLQLEQTTNHLGNEVNALRRQLKETGRRLENQRSINKEAGEETTRKNWKIDTLSKCIGSLREKLEEVTDKTMTAGEKAKYLEQMIAGEEKTIESLGVEVRRVGGLLYKQQQVLYGLKQKEDAQLMEIGGIKASKKLIMAFAVRQDKELQRQKEIIYGLDYEVTKLESRLSRLVGADMEQTELEELTKKSMDLQAVLEERSEALNLYTTQVTCLEDDLRRVTAALAIDEKELLRLKDHMQDQQLLMDGGYKQLKKSESSNQERQVEENVLRLRVHQLENAIKNEGGKLYTLEKQRMEMDAAMKERQAEIAAHKEMLVQQKRALNEEKSKLTNCIQERNTKISRLQKRYHIAMGLLGKDEDGEQLSVTHIKIQKAQEKYLLQEEGDELDGKIRAAEKEILAMENTLKVVNVSNDIYKATLAPVEKDDPEVREKTVLESQFFKVFDTLKYRRKELAQLTNETKVLQTTIEELNQAEEDIKQEFSAKEREAITLDRELREQHEKLQRAERQLRKLQREVRQAGDPTCMTLEERDVAARELQEQNQGTLQQLAELVTANIECGPVVTRYLQEKGLSLPVLQSPTTSSRARIPPSPGPSVSQLSLASERASGSAASVVTLDPEQLDPSPPQIICGSTARLRSRPSKTQAKKSTKK